MILFDTSAIYALADRDDPAHGRAKAILQDLAANHRPLLLHGYVLCEASALLQARLGAGTAEGFLKDAARHEVAWVDGAIHAEALKEFSRLGARGVSLVDCVSFILMRRRRVTTAFAFDRHFVQQGFTLAGPPPG